MPTEIELKARVTDPDKLRIILSNLAVFDRTFEKSDVYYTMSSQDPAQTSEYGVRIRKEASIHASGLSRDTTFITQKSREIRGDIEINDENEFEVSSGSAFLRFLLHLGFREKNRKKKNGHAFLYEGMTVELTNVDGLGWFIEAEIIIPGNDEAKINESRERLKSFLEKIGIPETSLETRSYSSMLANNSGTQQQSV